MKANNHISLEYMILPILSNFIPKIYNKMLFFNAAPLWEISKMMKNHLFITDFHAYCPTLVEVFPKVEANVEIVDPRILIHIL